MSENVVNSMPINVASLARRSRLRRGDRIIRRIRGRRRASAARLAHREATAENARSSAKDGGPDDHAQRFPPRYPSWYKADRDLARQIVKIQNEKLAEACAANPERFVAFATVALQHPDLAAEQLEEGVKKYGLRGAGIGGNVNGEEISDPKFHPFWAKAEQLGVLVFIHPQGTAELEGTTRLQGNGLLTNTIGNPLETTIALSHLIFEGTLDRFPGLKICAAHGGGYLPSYAARSDAVMTTFPKRMTSTMKKKPTEYVRQLYYDTIVFTPEALRHLAAEAGPGQVVMGTDYPFPWTSTSVDHILRTPGLSDADRIAMLGGTAASLLGIKE